jgi:hypothetical protein
MKRLSIAKFRTALLVCSLATTAMASHAYAQSHTMQVNVPFAFHNGSQRLPAGVYRVEIQSDHVILLRGQSGSGFVMANPAIATTLTSQGKVIFNRYGDQYYLSEIWPQGTESGQRCVKTRQEKEAEIAANRMKTSTRELALSNVSR